ncbi:uncharacterized protein [Rhodnius prolixus]|uniref:uncharacterized protein n=1 Tax=Rhodnius prolixus TaxID=13249 RepID=UPI003D187D7E
MDQNEAFKEFVRLLLREKIIEENEDGDLEILPPDSWVIVEKAEVCSCKRESKNEKEILSNAYKSPLVNLLWHTLAKLDFIGIAGFLLPYLRPLLPCHINPKLMTQIVNQILPLLKKKKITGPYPKL